MSVVLFVGIALAGGVGAASRLTLDGLIRARTNGTVPWGTVTINVTGSLLLGLVAGLATHGVLPEEAHLVIGSGFLGGYTTFSTASFETVRLLQEGRWRTGLLHGLGMLVVASAAAGLGLWIGL